MKIETRCLTRHAPAGLSMIENLLVMFVNGPLGRVRALLSPEAISITEHADRLTLSYCSGEMTIAVTPHEITTRHKEAPVPVPAFVAIAAARLTPMSLDATLPALIVALRTAKDRVHKVDLDHVRLKHVDISLRPCSVELAWSDDAGVIGPVALHANSEAIWSHRGREIPEEAARLIILSWCPAPAQAHEENLP